MKTARNARSRIALAALATAALTSVAFGGTQTAAGGRPHQATGSQRNAAAPALVDPRAGGLAVALGEWTVAMEAKAIRPGPVTFVVTNRGKLVHGFEIERFGVDDDRGGDHDDDRDGSKSETRDLRPGETARLTLNLAPGRYKVECSVGDHDDMGMEGILNVRADAPLAAPPAVTGNTNAVAITGFAYRPSALVVKAGTTVRWTNRDAAPHTVTATNGSFSSRNFGQGAGYSRKFTRPGTYRYLCALHPQMKGTVTVR